MFHGGGNNIQELEAEPAEWTREIYSCSADSIYMENGYKVVVRGGNNGLSTRTLEYFALPTDLGAGTEGWLGVTQPTAGVRITLIIDEMET